MKTQFIRASYFVWIVIPVALYFGYLAYGLPHMIWSYSYRQVGPASASNPFAGRYYTRCTFIGPYGSFSTYPTNGKCAWVRFFKKQEGG